MNYSEFQQQYEHDADKEAASLGRLAPSELVERVRTGHHGQHFQIWRAIAQRVPLASAGPLLIDVLRSDAEYLTRYHAAAALLGMLKISDIKAVDLAVAGREQRIDAVEATLRRRLSGG